RLLFVSRYSPFAHRPCANRQERTAALLPDFTKQFAAQALTPRLAPRHHALRRGQDVDAHAAQYARNLGAAHIDAAARTRYPRQVRDHRLVVVAVFQIHAQDLVALFFRRLEVRDIALFFQNAGNLRLQLGSWYIHFLVPGADRVADARQHVCDRIGQPHRLLLLEPPVRSASSGEPVSSLLFSVVSRWSLDVSERPTTDDYRLVLTRTTLKLLGSRPAAPTAGNTVGKCQTSADRPADVRKSCSGCAGASRTSASSRPSLVLL